MFTAFAGIKWRCSLLPVLIAVNVGTIRTPDLAAVIILNFNCGFTMYIKFEESKANSVDPDQLITTCFYRELMKIILQLSSYTHLFLHTGQSFSRFSPVHGQ